MQICIDSTIYLTSRGYHYKLKELVAFDRQVLNLGRESKKQIQVLTCYGSELVLPRPWFHKRILFLQGNMDAVGRLIDSIIVVPYCGMLMPKFRLALAFGRLVSLYIYIFF
jgi:hypothetical protein